MEEYKFSKELFKEVEKVKNKIPNLDSETDYWLVRAQGGKYYTDFNINNYVGIGWNEVSLNDIDNAKNSSNLMKQILKQKIASKSMSKIDLEDEDLKNDDATSENQYGSWSGQLLRFRNSLKINDIVLVPSQNSELFLVGKIENKAYELSYENLNTQNEESNYEKSDFLKRYPVKWIGKFNRSDADSKLYKMIYSQTTLTNINEYKPFINRALYPYYIEDEKLFITMQVTQPDDIEGIYLGQLVYQYSKMLKTLSPKIHVTSKVNVQSAGIIEFIANNAGVALLGFGFLAAAIVAPYGGKFKVFGQSLETNGFINGYINSKKIKTQNEKEELEKIEKAVKLAKELDVPISELGVTLPKGLIEILNDKDNEKKQIKGDEDNSTSH